MSQEFHVSKLSIIFIIFGAICCIVMVILLSSGIKMEAPNITWLKAIFKSIPKIKHKLAVLVPFRDRFNELLMFAPHIDAFLTSQDIDYHIFVLNQIDKYRFNRASLINVGFLETKEAYDYIAIHDVDLIPLNPDLSYEYPEAGPFHITAPDIHPLYHFASYLGGVVLVKREHFEQINGMSNKFWGWGIEDDEFNLRFKEEKLNVSRPIFIFTNKTNTFRHNHDQIKHKRDSTQCKNQPKTLTIDQETGLNDVVYKIQRRDHLTIHGVPVTILNVKLHCDELKTPWCQCD